MNLTAMILLSTCLVASAHSHAQTVSLSLKDAPLEKVFTEIKKQTGYSIFYNYRLLEKTKPVTIHVKNVSVEGAMKLCLKDQGLDFEITERSIVIKQQQNGLIQPGDNNVTLLSQIDVHGRIVNENGEPMLASIQVKGTDKGTTTNSDGYFELKHVEENAILVISATNIETREIKLNGKNDLDVVRVKMKIENLNEVVINKGYYTTLNRLNTGTVSTINSKDIQKQPIDNPLLALEGRVPGVVIVQNNGLPGGGIDIQIRGQNSLRSTANEPLYIIDGVPYNSQLLPNLGNDILQQTNGNFAAGGGNPLSFINPNDIESISILKDADATAIYGSRGANGVVLITTKKGISGKSKVNITVSQGIGKVSKMVPLLNTQQYLEMRNIAFANDAEIPDAYNAPDLVVWDTTKYTDWQKTLIGGTAKYTNAQATISGGDKNVQYVVGGTFYRETTVFPGSFSDKKGSVHFNLNTVSNNQHFQTTLSAMYLADNRTLPQEDFTFSAYLLAPNAPDVYNPDGSLNWANSTWPIENPYVYLLRTYNTKAGNLLSNLNLNYNLVKGLDISMSMGYTKTQVEEILITPISSLDPGLYPNPTGSSSFTANQTETWIIEPKLSYKFTVKNNQFDAIVGSTFQMNRSDGQITDATGYTSDALLKSMQAASNRSIRSYTSSIYKYNAAFSRIGYNYSNKYILNFTARRDGSSRFGENNRFHNFGSIGGAWLFKEETFLKNSLPLLSFGKIKGSYGTTGNDQIGDYQFYDLYYTNQYTYQGTPNVSPHNLYNPNLAWEETKKLDLGLELGFSKNRILLDADYYNNKSSNQLVSYVLPTVTGFPSISSNFPATVRNWGFEFYVNAYAIKSKNFSWSSNFNITIPKNKLAAFPNIENTPYGSSLIIGQPITIKKVYQVAGVNDTTGAYQFFNSKGAVTYAPNSQTDNTAIVNTAPDYYGGLGNTFSYKGFQLDVFFHFVKQLGKSFLYQKAQPFGNFYSGNQTKEVLNNWRRLGDNSTIQGYTESFASLGYNTFQYMATSDYAYTDASFIRLKNVSLSYQLSNSLIKKAILKDCRLYILGQNLLTITKYKGPDPEATSGLVLPPLRIVTVGLSATF